MRTAETIINEYLEQGYSLESLRVLAESRSEPLAGEMLAILDMLQEGERATETRDDAVDETREAEGSVFFIADDDSAVTGDIDAVDFNAMADKDAGEDIPACLEESVAEILIGETDGSDLVEMEYLSPAVFELSPATEDNGVWSRIWSGLNATTASATEEPEAAADEPAGDIHRDAEEASTDIMASTLEAETPPSPEEPPAVSEGSSDYLPGSVVIQNEESALVEMEQTVEPQAMEDAGEPMLPAALTGTEPVNAEADGGERAEEKKTSRRERRRRERAEKKKRAKKVKQETEVDEGALPEIVLTRSEGTDTMIPEAATTASASAEAEDGGTVEETTAEPGDHAMIIAAGGLDLRSDAFKLLAEGYGVPLSELDDYDPEEQEAATGNVILFRPDFGEFDEAEAEEGPEYRPFLRMLPPFDQGEEDFTPDTAGGFELSSDDKIGLVRAFFGTPEAVDAASADSVAGAEHVILSQAPESAREPGLEEALQAKMEQEYQERLDSFAARILEAQAHAAASETKARESLEALDLKQAELDATKTLLAEGETKLRELSEELEGAHGEARDTRIQLDQFQGLRDEHKRLYLEFEDLRKAYNEVVTDVMPELQSERDDLAVTVERQCETEEKLRASLGSSRKRLAVGYSLGAAACMMMVGMPLFNWMKSGDHDREIAVRHQQISELRERAEKAELRNVNAEKTIFELERKVNMVQMELAKLERQGSQGRELANLRPGGGTPTRTTTMALQGNPGADGRLHMNEVRDPVGSIDEVLASNRNSRQDNRDGALASRDNRRIPVSNVASTAPASGGRSGGSMRPPQQSGLRPASVAAAPESAARPGEVKAKVKAGEGVAQVVYRVLGTRDPEVINWVIRENGIKSDRRGNPRIYPDQELRLPQGGRLSQSASASRR